METHQVLKLLCVSLEAHLGAYESECLRSKPRSRELNHLEEVLKQTFVPVAKDIQALRSTLFLGPRVNELLVGMDNGDNGEEAVCRFFLRTRYSNSPGDNRVTVGDVTVRLYVGRSQAISAANEYTTVTGEQFKPFKTKFGNGYILRNMVTEKFYHAKGEIPTEIVSELMP